MSDYPDHFTQPEPINHNELRRMLIECFDAIIDNVDLKGASMFPDIGGGQRERLRRSVHRTIESIVLNGDDS